MSDHITVVGNVVGDIRHVMTPAGLPITSFSLASSQRRLDRATGAWVETATNWYTVSAFRALALNARDSLSTGQRVIVSGRLRLRRWENGDRRGTAPEIDAEALGPDLLWGTAAFHPSTQRASTADAGASGVDGWGGTDPAAPPAGAPETWATGGEAAEAVPRATGGDTAEESEATPPARDWASAPVPF
ncbi:single-stranded DNA-binding protein [Microbacterium sp. NPDC078428]|uniref:single-stranded DNA-binding protein n=1 Tax=Microbacterium sp. NPDC078428 TaxID=3364190 RepID=UPI0037C5BD30